MTELRKIFAMIVLVAASVAVACQKTAVEGSIELEKNEIIVPDSGAPVEVRFSSTTDWRIEYNLENGWLTTDLMGGRPETGVFTVKASANKSESVRVLKIRIFTLDGRDSKEIAVMQLSSYPSIIPDAYSLVLTAAESNYKIPLTSNVTDDAISVLSSADWVTNIRIEESVLKFTALQNEGTVARTCVLDLECSDEYGRSGDAVIKLHQAEPSKYNGATESSISAVLSYPDGKISDNVFVDAYVTVNGTSRNYDARRYILQDASGNTIVLESEALIAMDAGKLARIALMDTNVETRTEGTFTYKVFTGVTIAHLLKTEDSDYAVPQTTIGDLSDSDVFKVVRLKDVEVALNAGAYTNFKTCYNGNNDQRQPEYFVNKFPSLYRWYPVPLRDKEGCSIYMLSKFSAPWAHRTLPAGSGDLTGLIVKVNIKSFDIQEDSFCIVPLNESDLQIDEFSNSISTIIAEWDCNAKLAGTEYGSDIVAMTRYNPDGGLLAGNEAAVLNKSGNTGFARWYKDNLLGYQDSFRGDSNLTDADDGWWGTLSNGYYGRVNGGAFNSKPWSNTQYFYIDGISTLDISGSLSLQVSMNVTRGYTDFVIEYSNGVNAESWTKVEGSEFRIIGQFDRTDTARQTEDNIPGYKFYTFNLPDDLLGKDNICIRLRAVSSTDWQPVRLDHISLKHNN